MQDSRWLADWKTQILTKKSYEKVLFKEETLQKLEILLPKGLNQKRNKM